jgi:hypothetical protein
MMIVATSISRKLCKYGTSVEQGRRNRKRADKYERLYSNKVFWVAKENNELYY